MRCGNCKQSHATVADVKTCYGLGFHKVAPIPTVSAVAPTLAALIDRGATEDIEAVYLLDGTYYKVQQSDSSGAFYAKEWVAEQGGLSYGHWQYVGRRPLYHLTRFHELTAEQAAEFGHVTGQCVFCSRKLTDERSIAVGYGQRCAEREGLPWG